MFTKQYKYAIGITLLAIMVSACTQKLEFDYIDDFSLIDRCVWNPCQMNEQDTEIRDGKSDEKFLRIVGRPDTMNHESCEVFDPPVSCGRSGSIEESSETIANDRDDRLVKNSITTLPDSEECNNDPRPVQRNEYRFYKEVDGQKSEHSSRVMHWYKVRFRRSGGFEADCSTRWSLFQWKVPDNYARIKDRSPVFALRTDNGVLHVTVQNDACRCIVARAPGNISNISQEIQQSGGKSVLLSPPGRLVEVDNDVLMCEATNDHGGFIQDGEVCKSDLLISVPENVSTEITPALHSAWCDDPKSCRWTDIAIAIKRIGPGNDGEIDIYEDGRFVARVAGLIGYERCDSENQRLCCTESNCIKPYNSKNGLTCFNEKRGNPDKRILMCSDQSNDSKMTIGSRVAPREGLPVRFKFGHYRDQMDKTSYLDINRLCISTDENAQSCGAH